MQALNIKQLEAFCAVVEQGSFTGAAEKLYLSQSTISGHVAGLEKDLGVALLVRSGKRQLELTIEGRRVYEHAKSILDSCNALSLELEVQTSRDLVVAASSIPMQYVLPPLVAGFAALRPDCRFTLRQGSSQEIHRQVLQGEAHVGFVGAVFNEQDLRYDRICSDPLVLVTPDNDRYRRLWEQGRAGNELLQSEPLLFREGGSGTQVAGQRFLTENGIDIEKLNVAARIENSEALLRLVSCGMGCAVVSGRAAGSTRGLLSFPLVGKSTFRDLYMIQPKDRRPTKVARSFMDHVLSNRE